MLQWAMVALEALPRLTALRKGNMRAEWISEVYQTTMYDIA